MTLALIRPTQLYIWKGPSLLVVDERRECGWQEQLSGEIVRKRGTLHLVKQPPPESLHAGVFDRLSARFDGVRH